MVISDGKIYLGQFELSLCVDLLLFDDSLHWNLKVHQMHEFAIWTSSQGGNEKWQLMSKLVYWCSFSWSKPKYLWQFKQHELDLNVS